MSHAAEQIMSTREIFDKNYGIKKFVARIVCSKTKTAEINSNAFKRMDRLMKMLKKEYGIKYKPVNVKTTRLT